MATDLFSKSEVPSLCLRDVERTEAFRAAINKVVKPGDVVLDAGSGSGILSFFAAAAGARKVYAVEYDPGLAETLRGNAALNGFSEVIEVIAGDVRELRLPVQVDVLIAEMIETWLLDELQIPALNALRANRVIGAKTRIIPERYEAFATFGHVDFDCYGFQLPFPLHDWPDLDGDSGWQVLPFKALTEPVKAFKLDFGRYNDPDFRTTIRANAVESGTINAVRLTGVAHLAPELTLGPTVAFNGNKVLPIDPVTAQTGDPVSLSLSGNWGGGAWQLSSVSLTKERVKATNDEQNIQQHIYAWIQHLAVPRSELAGFAACPFAKNAKVSIQITRSNSVEQMGEPLKDGVEVVIYVLEEEVDFDGLMALRDSLNSNYPDLFFIDDHRNVPGFIQGVRTTNGQYNLILKQRRNSMLEARKALAKTEYYSLWSQELIDDVLGDDPDTRQTIREK